MSVLRTRVWLTHGHPDASETGRRYDGSDWPISMSRATVVNCDQERTLITSRSGRKGVMTRQTTLSGSNVCRLCHDGIHRHGLRLPDRDGGVPQSVDDAADEHDEA